MNRYPKAFPACLDAHPIVDGVGVVAVESLYPFIVEAVERAVVEIPAVFAEGQAEVVAVPRLR